MPATWCRLVTLNCLRHGKGTVLSIDTYSIDTYSGYGFAFLELNASAIHGLTECLIHCHGYATQHNFRLRNSLHSKRSVAMGPAHGIHWSYHVPHHLEAVDLIQLWNELLKTNLHCQLAGHILCRAWPKFFRRLCVHWISVQYMMLFLQQPEFTGPEIKDRKWKWHSSLLL